MEKLKIRNKLTYEVLETDKEYTTGPSQTIPDDTLSIKQILAKHIRGMNIALEESKTPIYLDGDLDSEDVESLSRMDLAERHEYVEALKAENQLKIASLKKAMETIEANQKSRSDNNPDGGDDETVDGDGRPQNGNNATTKEDARKPKKQGRPAGSTVGVAAGESSTNTLS